MCTSKASAKGQRPDQGLEGETELLRVGQLNNDRDGCRGEGNVVNEGGS